MVARFAFRNLRRNLRRTILTVTAIALGTALALFSIGLGDGGHQQMIENGVRIGQGHLTVQRQGYLESPSSSLYIRQPGKASLPQPQAPRGLVFRVSTPPHPRKRAYSGTASSKVNSSPDTMNPVPSSAPRWQNG
jgi:ABC-type antimicrobial peptide transport system permease subunit